MTLGRVSWQIKAGLVTVLCLVLIKFLLVPLYEWQDETIQRIKVLQKVVVQKKALVGNESRLNTLLQKEESSFKEISKFYYHNFSDAQALQLKLQKKMERLSASCEVKIKSTDWLYPSEGHIVQAPIKIRCEAVPNQIIKFIHAIESSRHFFSIDRLKIISRAKSSVIYVELDVSAYGVTN
ncbi:MAG: hypothetical protein GWP10_16385 [Nitrospiraceae bacterium]|nr:hypothetical protein [Nitrospiraceae bacterium]